MVDYHNHTTLCGHASGSIEEYIETAISNRIKEIGFSDHAPIPLPNRKGITMDPEQTEGYISMLEENREKYKGKIDVKIGFEVDFPLFDSFNRKYFSDSRIDFLIGSCHYLGDWAFDHPRGAEEFKNRDIDKIYTEYYKIIISLIDSRLFNIVGHFDIVKKFGNRPKKDFRKTIETIAKEMAGYDIAVEVNASGLSKPVKELYPSDEILEIFFKSNTPVTLGSDSHHAGAVAEMTSKMIEKIKKAGYRKVSGFTKRKRHDVIL